MGKTIKLTEEQIHRFFGEGFGKRLLGESGRKLTVPGGRQVMLGPEREFTDETMPKPYAKTSGHVYMIGVDNDGNPITSTTDNDENGLFYTGQDYIPREKSGDVDLPGWAGSVAKMADFGQANLTKDNAIAGNSDSEELLVKIREVFDKTIKAKGLGTTMNILDVLKILHQIKGNAKSKSGNAESKGDEITEDDAIQFLNSLSIDYILSNFITVNAPDYVFWRLKNLSEKEINNIINTYGRDFHEFGQRCDGCGAVTWKTTVSPFEHDDAHINFEYMGGDAAGKGKKLNEDNEESLGYNSVGKVYEAPLPFQIHHMNENPGDNSPLNLSCLCPNCHAITGSHSANKKNFNADSFGILQNNNTAVKEDSLNGFLNDEEVNRIADSIKKGKYESGSIVNGITGVNIKGTEINEFMFDPNNAELQKKVYSFGVNDPASFISDFDGFFASIYNEGAELFNEFIKNLNKSKSPNIPNSADDSSQITEAKSKTPEQKGFNPCELGGIHFQTKVSITPAGNVYLQIFCGEEPFVFSAFKNNSISLTRMYFEIAKNKIAAITGVRNSVFNACLNAVSGIKHKLSSWTDNAPYWIKDKEGNIVPSNITSLKSGDAESREKIRGFFQDSGGDTNAAITREKKLKSQARSTDVYTQRMLDAMGIILTAPDDKMAKLTADNQLKNFGESLINYLLDQRVNWKGKKLGDTDKQRREKIKEILRVGKFY